MLASAHTAFAPQADGAGEMRAARVLVVDDEASICALLASVLPLPKYAVTTHGSAEDALADFEPGHFDIALLDKNLPGQSGLEFLAAQADLAESQRRHGLNLTEAHLEQIPRTDANKFVPTSPRNVTHTF